MSQHFSQALKLALVHEGGFSNHPKDPGGVTLEGVTQRTYDAFRIRSGKAKRNLAPWMRNTPEWLKERDTIYKEQYWDVVRGDQLPAGVGYVVFDGAVNSGASRSAKWLQKALGVRVDGVIGEITLAAIRQHHDHDLLVAKILDLRLAFLKALKTWNTFGKGWLARIKDALKSGQAMACGSVPVPGQFVAGCNAKAVSDDAKHAPSAAVGDITLGAGAGGGATAGALNAVAQELAPYTDVSFIRHIVIVLIIASAVMTVGGFAYRIYASRKRREIEHVLDVREAPI